jgi:putative FmdB family regulatory protein
MPTYRYECARCARVHEVFHSINEPPRRRCPECGGKLTRLIGGGAGVILKGSGFHATDYRKKSFHEAARREEGGAKDGKKESTDSKGKKESTDSKGKKDGPAKKD